MLISGWTPTSAKFHGGDEPEYFPFWFVDIWIMETFELAFCQPCPVIQNLAVGSRRGSTGNMHDLRFWFDFFEATRGEHARDAERVARASETGVTPDQVTAKRALQHERCLNQIERIPIFERSF